MALCLLKQDKRWKISFVLITTRQNKSRRYLDESVRGFFTRNTISSHNTQLPEKIIRRLLHKIATTQSKAKQGK